MKVLFVTKGDKGVASSRVRVWSVAEKLAEQYGIKYEVLHSLGYPLFSISLRRFTLPLKLIRKVINFGPDVLYIHKSLIPWDMVVIISILALLLKIRIIFDMDDPQWIHSPSKTAYLVRIAKTIFCGSHNILDWTKERTGFAELIPSAIDMEGYSKGVHSPQNKSMYMFAWVGNGPGHFSDGNLTIMRKLLDTIYEEGVSFEFVFIGALGNKDIYELFSGTVYDVKIIDTLEWKSNPHATAEALRFHDVDLGFMPLKDIPFSYGKCSYKALEYMAAGIPAIVSDIGENGHAIQHMENGLLIKGENEDALLEAAKNVKEIFSDLELRTDLARKGIEKVDKDYSYKNLIPRIYQLLQ